jgi:hypothetical protein
MKALNQETISLDRIGLMINLVIKDYPNARTPEEIATIIQEEYNSACTPRMVDNWLNEPSVDMLKEDARRIIPDVY